MSDSDPTKPAVQDAFYERSIRAINAEGTAQMMVIERLPAIINGELATNLFPTPKYFGIGLMMLGPPGQQQPHQFEYEIIGATNPVEAFDWMADQVERGRTEEMEKMRKLALRARLAGKGRG